MKMIKGLLALVVVASILISTGCGGAGGGPPTIISADFFHLAIVPNQVVNTPTFTVQVIAENINPLVAPTAPIVRDANGVAYTMALVQLTYPLLPVDVGVPVNSVKIYSYAVPLNANAVNAITVTSGAKTINLNIKQKATLNIQTAMSSAELVAKIRAAQLDATVDEILIGYAEPTLGTVLHNIGNTNYAASLTVRTYWLTIRPTGGFTSTWIRNSSVAATSRPYINYLHLDGIQFGSDTDDDGGGTLYPEQLNSGYKSYTWVSNSAFKAKYKYNTWTVTTAMTAPGVDPISVNLFSTGAQQVYATGNSYDGSAATNATFGYQLARDLTFTSERGDINDFGRVLLNISSDNMVTVTIPTVPLAAAQVLHNDVFQVWGVSEAAPSANLVAMGVRVLSTGIPANVQPFFLDGDGGGLTATYDHILIDTFSVSGAGAGTVLAAQLAGTTSNTRVSNISIPQQTIFMREDFVLPGVTPWAANNVQLYNTDSGKISVLYANPPAGSTTYSVANANCANPNNCAPEMNANAAISATTFRLNKVH
jgi:hypothetical protein